MDKKTFVAFDQYQRYETVARIIDYSRKVEHRKSYRILELGANEHKNMRLFLPKDKIVFTDIELTESMRADSDFEQADGTELSFETDSFDFVFAVDVLEHIQKEKREKFLSEALRVASKGIILSFPYESQAVIDAETRVNAYYKAVSGQDFIWLKEHIENGLPRLNEIDAFLKQKDWNYYSFFHGEIRTWEKMWYCHFNTVFAPETLEYRTNIDHYYNCYLYDSDVSDFCYRVFYVISNMDIQALKEYTAHMWTPRKDLPESHLELLIQAHRNVHPLYVQELQRRELVEKELQLQRITAIQNEKEVEWHAKESQYESFIQQSRIELEQAREEFQQALSQAQMQMIQGEKQIQEDAAQELKRMKEESAQQLKEVQKASLQELSFLNAKYSAVFSMMMKARKECQQLREAMDYRQQTETEERCRLDVELAHYKEHYLAAINQREELKGELAQVQYAYNVISNAFFWKITKPFRVVLDGIKGLLKSNRYTYLCWKGLKCWKENGTKYTWKKVEDKLHHRQDFTKAVRPLFTEEELEEQRRDIFPREVKFSIVVPLYNTPEEFLHEMIQSVLDQTYENWELCMADGSDSEHQSIEKICRQYIRKDSRIKYRKLERNLGISENTNACIDMASGDYIALFDHDDLLHPAALHEVMKAICGQNADFIYTDENTFHRKPEDAYCPHFKPDFAPDTLRSYNYICHFTVFQSSLLNQTGKFQGEFDGSQDYDMILRLTECASHIIHIPEILYYWRAHQDSVAEKIDAKPYTLHAARCAIKAHLDRVGLKGKVLDSIVPSTYRICYELEEAPLISIIIPNMDHVRTLRTCIESILKKTSYPNYEIIVVENNSKKSETFSYYEELKENPRVQIVIWTDKFNYSAINNFGVQYANGDYFLLLNNDIEVISEDWLQEMLMFCQRKDVGVVGAMLYYPDDTIQHAGVILGLGGIAGHSHKHFLRSNVGYMYRTTIAQNLSAVTGACMMVRRDVWVEMDGLDTEFEVAFNDVDFCMRIRKAGYLIVWTPYAELYHYESKSRGFEDTPEKQKRFAKEIQRFKTRWRKELGNGDPYYNPNLTLDREDFSLS